MASIAKRDKGWRAQIALQGVRESKTFATKAEAVSWAAARETEIRRGAATGVQRGRTVDEAFRRYEKEVSSQKRGHEKEAIRLNAIGRMLIDEAPLREWKLADVTTEVLGKWRDNRLHVDKVKGSSINRDLNLLSHVFSRAVKEWKWLSVSPTTDLRRPDDPPHRDRLYTDDEITRICLALGLDTELKQTAATKSECVALAFLFAIETAMRAGEICALLPSDIVGRTATLRQTKNGTKRTVPLSPKAMQLLKLLPAAEDGEPVFGVKDKSLDALFRKGRDRAMVKGATFHDTRHLAITRLARKLSVLDLARMVGHRDLRQLQVYYNASAEDIAARLD